MYIPSMASELRFTAYNGMTADAQRAAFWDYVNRNSYLSERKGQYAERYGEIQPWLHRFDAKLLQDIFANFGSEKRYTLQFSVDFLNVGNLINDSWGRYIYNPLASFENVRPLRVNNRGTATSAPVYTLNATSLDDFKTKTTLTKNVSTSSTWGCLLGIRLIF
jgi:predicted LPLAT superfamily acyltransferase